MDWSLSGRRLVLETLVALCVGLVVPCAADGDDELADLSLEDLLALEVVSVSRTGETLDELPSSVTRITREQIVASRARNIPEVLRGHVGLEVLNSTSSTYDVGARGGAELLSNSMLVLIDGRPVNEELGGNVLWGFLPVGIDQVQSIEIIRGPASAMFGANAFTGVLNIVTIDPRHSPGTASRFRVSSLDQSAGLHLATRTPATAWRLDMGAERIDERVMTSDVGSPAAEVVRGHLSWHRTLQRDRRLRFTAGMAHGRSEVLPLTVLQSTDFEGYAAYVRGEFAGADWSAQLSTRMSNLDFIPMENDLVDAVRDIETRTDFATAQRRIDLPRGNTLVVGADLRSLSFQSETQERREDVCWAVFAQDKWLVAERLILNLGARYDDHPRIDEQLTARASLVARITDRHTLSVVAASAFLTPTFVESAFRFSGEIIPPSNGNPGVDIVFTGNPEVDPQRIRSLEFGWRGGLLDELEVSLTGYEHRVDDVIELGVESFHSVPPAPVPGIPARLTYYNRTSHDVRGLEATFDWSRSPGLLVRGTYGYILAESEGEALLHVPRHRASLGIDTRIARAWQAGVLVHTSSRTEWLSENAFTVGQTIGTAGDFVGVDVHVERNLGPVSATAGVRNVLDQTIHDHPLGWCQGRTVFVGLDVAWD